MGPIGNDFQMTDDDNEAKENFAQEEETNPLLPRSRIPDIWAHFNAQLDRIDELEKRLNEHATRSRRRIASVLDQKPNHRRSSLRMFVTHKYDKALAKWTLVIEGKLLVGLLDHKSAARVEEEGVLGVGKETTGTAKDYSITPSTVAASAAAAAARGELDPPSGRAARDQYRSVGEREEDPVEPVFFTHFFEKIQVTFQTIYQPKSPPASSLTPPKKSRKRKVDRDPVAVNAKHLKAGDVTTIVWTKADSVDSQAFFVNYFNNENQRPPPPGMKFHSVVSTITLHSARGEPLFKPSPALADKFFPRHRNEPRTARGVEAKRKKNEANSESEPPPAPIPLDNDIHVPALLSTQEILMAFFQYIHDKKLQDQNDKSLIICDKVLSDLLECESFSFSQLHQTLLSRNLMIPVQRDEEPTVLTYIMNEKTTSPQQPPGTTSEEMMEEEGHQHQVLSFDMDVAVPILFHYRSRELLRRIKRREFEYTSSRTKARYLLVASRGDEDIVKAKLEQVVSGHGYSVENIPVFLALAKAAPPNSEARNAAQIDAKTCALVGRVDECTRRAQSAWDLVEACSDLITKE